MANDILQSILSPSATIPQSDDAADVEEVVETIDEVPQDGGEPEEEIIDEEIVEETSEEEETVESEELAETEVEEPPYLDVTDDDLIEVKIDGEVELKTLGELKAALSGEGAVQKRLKEATEARKAVDEERSKWLTEAEEAQQLVGMAIQSVQNGLFAPMVGEPDETLRATNPQEYLLQETAWRKDQARIQEGTQQLGQLFQQHRQAIDNARKEHRVQQSKLLATKLPIIHDKEKGKAVQEQMIKNAMESYGLTPEEISKQSDHRLFLMAYDAMLYRQGQTKADVVEIKEEKRKRSPRTLRSGANKRKLAAKRTASQAKAATDRARETGKAQDVALTLLKPAGTRR